MRPFRPLMIAGIAVGLACLSGCSSPQRRADQMAQKFGYSRQIVRGSTFEHVLYRPGTRPITAHVLHVYIEGDGSPYVGRMIVAADPTPVRPVALALMHEDTAPALYLGRPCYFGLAKSSDCVPAYWTSRRFSPEVVASMAAVLRAEIARDQVERVTLIGHSGGATLALLLAGLLPQVDQVVTVAGNLDVGAWTLLHHYAPLTGSLDPVVEGLRGHHPVLYHFAGGRDRNIPPTLIAAAAARLGGSVTVYPRFDHTCCWAGAWPDIIRNLPSVAVTVEH